MGAAPKGADVRVYTAGHELNEDATRDRLSCWPLHSNGGSVDPLASTVLHTCDAIVIAPVTGLPSG